MRVEALPRDALGLRDLPGRGEGARAGQGDGVGLGTVPAPLGCRREHVRGLGGSVREVGPRDPQRLRGRDRLGGVGVMLEDLRGDAAGRPQL